MTSVDAAIERLLRAYEAAGGKVEEFDPVAEADLDALRLSVAPLRLPTDIEALWRRFQVDGVPGIIDTHSLAPVEVAIGAQGHTFQSRALLSIGGDGQTRCFLELDDARGAGGGAVWTVDEFAPELREAAPSVASLLDATAAAWERGVARLSPAHPFPWAVWDQDAWARLKAEMLPAGRLAGSRPRGWLPRWLAAERLTAADVEPRGATTTVAALLAAGEGWRTAETIRGRVSSLVSAIACGATIDDGTGRMAVYIPREADLFALLRFDHDIELDVRRFPAGTQVEPPFDADGFDGLAVFVRDA